MRGDGHRRAQPRSHLGRPLTHDPSPMTPHPTPPGSPPVTSLLSGNSPSPAPTSLLPGAVRGPLTATQGPAHRSCWDLGPPSGQKSWGWAGRHGDPHLFSLSPAPRATLGLTILRGVVKTSTLSTGPSFSGEGHSGQGRPWGRLLNASRTGLLAGEEAATQGGGEAPGGLAACAGQPELLRARPPRESPSQLLSGWTPLSVTFRALTLVVLVVRHHGGLVFGTPAHKVLSA